MAFDAGRYHFGALRLRRCEFPQQDIDRLLTMIPRARHLESMTATGPTGARVRFASAFRAGSELSQLLGAQNPGADHLP